MSPKNKNTLTPGVDYPAVAISFFAHDGNGNFLLFKRTKNKHENEGYWESGGGRLHKNETLEEGLRRELLSTIHCEEVCIDEVLSPVTQIYRNKEGQTVHWIILPHIVKINPNEITVTDEESLEAIGWFELSSLPDPLHHVTAQVIVDFRELFTKYK